MEAGSGSTAPGRALRETNNMMNRRTEFRREDKETRTLTTSVPSRRIKPIYAVPAARVLPRDEKAANYGRGNGIAPNPAFHFSAKEVHAIVDNIPEPRNVPRSWTQTSAWSTIFLSRSRSRPFPREIDWIFLLTETFLSWDLNRHPFFPDARNALPLHAECGLFGQAGPNSGKDWMQRNPAAKA